eukprot:6184553-Pleurochrysis_carterae.AAC.3
MSFQFSRSRLPLLVPVSSGHRNGFGAGVCPGTAPGALSARFSARWRVFSMGCSLGGHTQGPLLSNAWAQRGAP